MVNGSDKVEPMRRVWVRCDRYLSNHFTVAGDAPTDVNFFSNHWWFILSNAFERSNKIRTVIFLLSIASSMLSVM